MYPSIMLVSFLVFAFLTVNGCDDRYKGIVATMVAATESTSYFNQLISKHLVTACSALSVDVVRQCYRVYLQTYALGIDSAGKLPPYQFYLHATSVYSFQQICGPANVLMSCINTRIPSNCVNIALFRVLTYNDEDAFNYLGSYAAFEYICGEGYTEFVSNEDCFVRASTDPNLINQLQSCGIAIDPNNPTAVCNSALSDASCVYGIYEGYCGSQLAHGMCETRVNFVKRLEIIDAKCLNEMSVRCNSAVAYIIASKLVVIVVILSVYVV